MLTSQATAQTAPSAQPDANLSPETAPKKAPETTPDTLDIPGDLQAPDPDDLAPDRPLPDISELLKDLPVIENQADGAIGDDVIHEETESGLAKNDTAPDYSKLTKAQERDVRLDLLFQRIGAEDNAETAALIAEDIWAIWLDSGSESVNFILRRGTAAQKRGNIALARRMFDHVTQLSPDYSEGWSRSARLALEEKDFNRAFIDVTEALILEPRHFYALWTLGNVFERVGRNAEALEAYKEAHKLYPELKAVKDRFRVMTESVDGDVL